MILLRPALVQLRALPPEPLGRRFLLHKTHVVVGVAVTPLPVRALSSVVKGAAAQSHRLPVQWCLGQSTWARYDRTCYMKVHDDGWMSFCNSCNNGPIRRLRIAYSLGSNTILQHMPLALLEPDNLDPPHRPDMLCCDSRSPGLPSAGLSAQRLELAVAVAE